MSDNEEFFGGSTGKEGTYFGDWSRKGDWDTYTGEDK